MDADEKKKKPGWTEERVERLKKLWEEGLSASEIARILGGVTRNAVIGKVHRLRLAGRAPARRGRTAGGTARKTAQPAKPSRQAPTPVTSGATALKSEARTAPAPLDRARPAPVALVEPPKGRITDIMELNHKTCRWPIGDPGDEDFAYCGDHAQPGSPYCEHHARIAFQPAGDRRRRASG